MNRAPAVAGMFYDSNPADLREHLRECFQGPFGPGSLPVAPAERAGNVAGLVCPHAGYVYSGPAAAHAYAALAADGIPDLAVILGPNHYGAGAPIAIDPHQRWSTPLGTLERDEQVTADILRLCGYAREDDRPHNREHSVEVQLPFLQYVGATATKIVPIAIAHLNETDAAMAVADLAPAIATALEGRSAVIISSTDFSHYVTGERARTLDSLAIEQILRMDPDGLLQTVRDNQITMCGAVGTAVMLEAARRLGASDAAKLAYYTSGDISGDSSQVVGYGALSVVRA